MTVITQKTFRHIRTRETVIVITRIDARNNATYSVATPAGAGHTSRPIDSADREIGRLTRAGFREVL